MLMKKIFTLIGVALMVISTNAQSWNFSTWEAKTFAKGSTETIDGLTVNPSEKDIVIDGNNKTVDGVKYTQRLKFGGSGSPTTQNISFDVSGAGTLKVIVTSSSGSEDRKFGVALEGTEIAEKDAKGGAVEAVTVNITGAGKVAIYGKGGVNLYLVEFTTGGGGGGGDTGSKFTYELATADGIVADFATTTELKGRVFAKVNKDPIVIKAVAGKLPANADGGAQQMTPDLDNPISGKEYTYAVKSVEAWTDASFNANNKFTDWNAIDPKYNMYFLQGTGNPYTALYAEEIVKDEGATHTGTYRANYEYYEVDGGKLPATGCYYKLTPKANGTLKLGIFAGKGNRKTYFIEETSKVPVTYTVEGYIANQKYPEGYEDPAKVGKMKYLTDEEIKAIATEAGSAEYVIGHYNAHFYGYLNATVEKGKSYYLFLHNGQMGLSSVEFNYDEASLDKTIDEKDEITDTPDPTIITGISTLKSETSNTNAQMYNLSGQKVDKSYKGIVIQNGRKFVNK